MWIREESLFVNFEAKAEANGNLHHGKWVTSWRDCLRQVYVSLANLLENRRNEKNFEGLHDDEMVNYFVKKGFYEVWKLFSRSSWMFVFLFVNWNFEILIPNYSEKFRKYKNFENHLRLKCSIIFMSNKIKPKPSLSPRCPPLTSSRLSLVFRTSIHNDITITFPKSPKS